MIYEEWRAKSRLVMWKNDRSNLFDEYLKYVKPSGIPATIFMQSTIIGDQIIMLMELLVSVAKQFLAAL